jgi:hypothetical protein
LRPIARSPPALGVDEEGELALILGAVDRGVGSGVDDEIGPEAVEFAVSVSGFERSNSAINGAMIVP